MRNITVLVVVALYLIHQTEAFKPEIRLEKDYDYDGIGESYYLKTRVEGGDHYGLVCWVEENWAQFQYWEKYMSKWCEPYHMTSGSPYTGTDYPGEVDLELDCEEEPTDPGDCFVLKKNLMNCTYHVRVQCMDPMNDFERAQPLSGILLGVCIALVVAIVISWIGCCCIGSRKRSNSTTKTGAVHSQPQQQYIITQQQHHQQPCATTYALPPSHQPPQPGYIQQPPPQALYPPVLPTTPPASQPHTGPGSQPTAPSDSPPPPYGAATGIVEKL